MQDLSHQSEFLVFLTLKHLFDADLYLFHRSLVVPVEHFWIVDQKAHWKCQKVRNIKEKINTSVISQMNKLDYFFGISSASPWCVSF